VPRGPILSEIVRRVLDVTVATTLLLSIVPLCAIIVLAIHLESPGPVLIRQERIGLNGAIFRMYKFRSMKDGSLPSVVKERTDRRVTRVGKLLRRSSLDELPQLWNVLRGDMTLVGPRPELPCMLSLYEPHHFRRFAVLPGLTGLWQVSGRSNLPLPEKLALDLYYIEHRSLWLDLHILARTPLAVLTGRGAF
jgi:lipopolysaccharide/colanic/teichoic acid biosynthesis glycosyltransferase